MLILMYIPSLVCIMWKWSKSLLVVISMEVISIFALSCFIMEGLILSILMVFLVFFVSEALIMICSLFNSMRIAGSGFSQILNW